MERTQENQTATPLELFFDLVFVFALTQITAFMAHSPTRLGITQGLLVLALLWWAWVGYAWLCNLVRADEGEVRIVLLVAMTAMFFVALTIPEAFHDAPGGLSGPVVVAVCYVAFRLTHLALFAIYARGDAVLVRQLFKWGPTVAIGAALLVTAAFVHDQYLQTSLWGAVVAIEYGGTFLAGASGWRLRSAGHFAERHGLMVIVALGESIVAIGVGAAELPISWPVIAAGVGGMAVAAALWWMYFDVTATAAEHALGAAPQDGTQAAMARDAYSFAHLPMMTGIVLLALGLKKLLSAVGDPDAHHLAEPLKPVALGALFGGVLLYTLGHVAFKRRTVGTLSRPRLLLVAALVLAWLAVMPLPALAQVAVLAVLGWALVGYETLHYREQRRQIRHAGHHHN